MMNAVQSSMESRILMIDNSQEMLKKEGHLMSVGGNFERIVKEDGATRWSEMMQCVDFHVKMAARCWIPTKVTIFDFFAYDCNTLLILVK